MAIKTVSITRTKAQERTRPAYMVRSIIIMRTKNLRQADKTGGLFAVGGLVRADLIRQAPRRGIPAPAPAAGLPPRTQKLQKGLPSTAKGGGRRESVGAAGQGGGNGAGLDGWRQAGGWAVLDRAWQNRRHVVPVSFRCTVDAINPLFLYILTPYRNKGTVREYKERSRTKIKRNGKNNIYRHNGSFRSCCSIGGENFHARYQIFTNVTELLT